MYWCAALLIIVIEMLCNLCVCNPVLFHSRSRVRTEREERKIEGDLRRSQRGCEQLDSQKVGGILAMAQYEHCAVSLQ